MKLEIPYYSQFKDVVHEEWQDKACTVTCLKMSLDFLVPNRAPDLDTLVEEALIHSKSMVLHGLITEISASHGIPHEVIVLLAHNYGITAYREEFKSVSIASDGQMVPSQFSDPILMDGLKKISAMLETGSLPIVSVFPGLSEGNSFHTILLTGFEVEEGNLTGFYYHDPDARNEPKTGVFISLDDFLKHWRKMAIFIG